MDIIDQILGAERAKEYTDSQRLGYAEPPKVYTYDGDLTGKDDYGGYVKVSDDIPDINSFVRLTVDYPDSMTEDLTANSVTIEHGDGLSKLIGYFSDCATPAIVVTSPNNESDWPTGIYLQYFSHMNGVGWYVSRIEFAGTVHTIDPKFLPEAVIDLSQWGDLADALFEEFVTGGGSSEVAYSYLFWALNGELYIEDYENAYAGVNERIKNSGIFNKKDWPFRVVARVASLGITMDTIAVTKTFDANGNLTAISVPWSFSYAGNRYKVFITLEDTRGHGDTTVSVEILNPKAVVHTGMPLDYFLSQPSMELTEDLEQIALSAKENFQPVYMVFQVEGEMSSEGITYIDAVFIATYYCTKLDGVMEFRLSAPYFEGIVEIDMEDKTFRGYRVY